MKVMDLSPLKNNDAEFQKITTAISEKFKCDWDDSIHDSYGKYVSFSQQCSQEVRSIRCKAESLTAEVEDLEIEKLKNRAAELCKEADAV